jgi:hypothetical protein
MDTKTYGGVTAKDVIVFQTKIMMGAQFGRIVWARDQKSVPPGNRQNEILVACLRIGWNDAFRHTSENEDGINDTKESKGAVSTYVKKDKYKIRLLKLFRKKLKEEDFPADFDDYFSGIVEKLLDIFRKYASASTNKHLIIDSHWTEIEDCFRGVKKLDGDKKLSFGHIQKMFNIAIKLYLCLFMCREELGLDDKIFIMDIVDNFANADCPIDSIILGKLEQVEMQKNGTGTTYTTKYNGYTWSQLNSTDYSDIQDSIKNESGGNSNLWFDFDNWN